MRMSCNGCRVLRKGCSENCSIRPCLQWIKSPDSQANATFFLAKFYGRAGLLNLINSGPDHLRPAIFRSLLYEACGRIVNPIYGSVGMLWSGSWQLCQASVEAVLKGSPITKITSEVVANNLGPPLNASDIRHVSKDENSTAWNDLHKVKTRCRFKRSAFKPKLNDDKVAPKPIHDSAAELNWNRCSGDELNRSTSHDLSVNHPAEAPNMDGESRETESMESGETDEASLLFRAVPESAPKSRIDGSDLDLELTLGFEPVSRARQVGVVKKQNITGIIF